MIHLDALYIRSQDCFSFQSTLIILNQGNKFFFISIVLNHLNCLNTMEKSSAKTNMLTFPLVELLHALSIHLLAWVYNIESFFSTYWSSSRIQDEKRNQNSEFLSSQVSSGVKEDEGSICREDVEMLMGRFGLVCSPESDEMPERLGFEAFSSLFEEKEPSLEEMKQAFDVFDVNKDGFIDEEELQRVLSILKLREGAELSTCRRMIRLADDNGDGRIDFYEFVKLMENIFC